MKEIDQNMLGKVLLRVKFSPKQDVERWFYKRLLEEVVYSVLESA
jgi:hypothetical protein